MATYYINADTGDDGSGDGSEGNPWETLATAVTNASASDTIICQDSTATYLFANQTIGLNNLTIQGESDDASGAVFDASGAVRRWTISASTAVTISKITFTDILMTSSLGCPFDLNGANCTLAVSQCKFDAITTNNSDFQSSGLFGANNDQPFTVSFDNCLFNDLIADGTGGALFSTNNIAASASTLTVTNCVVYQTTAANRHEYLFNSSTSGVVTITATNNIFDNQTGSTVTFNNNTTYSAQSVTYNLTNNITTVPSGTGNITGDPLFVDAANNNFNLRPTSPAIKTGTLV